MTYLRRNRAARVTAAAAALAVAASAFPISAHAEYAVVDLGALSNTPTQHRASVGAVNTTGQAVLTTAPDATAYHGFRYDTGALLDLGTLGGTTSSAVGINTSGQIVGQSTTAGGIAHAYVWTPGGTAGAASNPQMKDLNPTGGVSAATAINSTGQVVGFVAVSHPGLGDTDRAFIYSGGTMTQLPLPQTGGYSISYAYGVNDAGKVVGEAYTALSPIPHGFFYNGSASVEIGDFGGGGSTPLAINKSDQVVGYSTTADGYDHAFSYHAGAITDLGTLGGGHYSYAKAIASGGQIVGGSFTDDVDSVYHAFSSDGVTMTDLNSKVTSKAADWVLNEATGVNDAGVIVGTGTLAGAAHGFLLRPLAAGDATADGSVDFNDLVKLAQNYNSSGPSLWEQGDFNGDGLVDFNDLVLLAQNYNTTQTGVFASSPAFAVDLAAAFAEVPEPSSVAASLSVLLLAAGTGRGRRRQTSGHILTSARGKV